MKKYIIIKADTNDADYVTEKNEISDENIELIKPIVEVIKSCEGYHNWECGEMESDSTPEILYLNTGLLTQEQIDLFENYIPYGEYGIHTIESVDILVVSEEIKLL